MALPSPTPAIPFPRDVDFVNRRGSDGGSTILEQIEQACSEPAAKVALVGIGGAGKSQLAIEYCYRSLEKSPEKLIFWVHASNIDRIEQGYRQIAERVGIADRDSPQVNILELVTAWMRDETDQSWLLVLDNLDDESLFRVPEAEGSNAQTTASDSKLPPLLSEVIPKNKNGTTLITTRTRSVAARLVESKNTIAVKPMIEADAVMLLGKSLNTPPDKQDLAKLAEVLEYMPLAIAQATAKIQQEESPRRVREYIKAFSTSEKEKTSLLNHEPSGLRRDEEATNSIIVAWQVSFEDILEKNPSAAQLLALMSYFDRQGIPEKILRVETKEYYVPDATEQGPENAIKQTEPKNAMDIEDPEMFEKAMEMLRNYSLVTAVSPGYGGRTFEMHALVQLATRTWLEMTDRAERSKAYFNCKLNTLLPRGDYENWDVCKALFPHVKAAESQRPTTGNALKDWALILHKGAWYSMEIGDNIQAERMSKLSLAACRQVLGEDHVDTLSALGMLAQIYSAEGRWAEAEPMQELLVEKWTKLSGEDHGDTRVSMLNLANTYQRQEKWAEAEKIQVKVLAAAKKELGEEDPETTRAMSGLATTYGNEGRRAEAAAMEAQVLEIERRVLGDEHPSTLTSMNNLAFSLEELGRRDEALELMVECYQTRKRILGEEHPNTTSSLMAINYWLMLEEREKEAASDAQAKDNSAPAAVAAEASETKSLPQRPRKRTPSPPLAKSHHSHHAKHGAGKK